MLQIQRVLAHVAKNTSNEASMDSSVSRTCTDRYANRMIGFAIISSLFRGSSLNHIQSDGPICEPTISIGVLRQFQNQPEKQVQSSFGLV